MHLRNTCSYKLQCFFQNYCDMTRYVFMPDFHHRTAWCHVACLSILCRLLWWALSWSRSTVNTYIAPVHTPIPNLPISGGCRLTTCPNFLCWYGFFPAYQPWPTNPHCNKLGWFFLSRRPCHVNVNGTLPQSAEAITGVPQCAAIGSFLFGIFVNVLPDRLSGIYQGFHVHLHMTARHSSTNRVVMPTCGHGATFW